jgi:predicted MFS family arabinose efflux permease
MRNLIKDYTSLDRSILNLIIVQFCSHLINLSFINILPLYMRAEGFTDAQYAHFTSYRYLGVLSLALFLGMYIKGRRILPFIYMSAVSVPLFALLIIFAVRMHAHGLILIFHLLWGVGFTFAQIPVLPFIFRNSSDDQHTRAISLSFSTQSIANIISSLVVTVFNGLNPVIFNEHNLLVFLSASGFVGIYFAYKINRAEQVPAITEKRSSFKGYDWKLILRSLFPTLLFAVGAGFIIPFIGLFFVNVYHMTTSVFSFLCFLTAILVTVVSMYVPKVKESFGYERAVPMSQIFAILALLGMATTQYYSHLSFAVYIAAFFYLLRQPLMSMAVPMILEVTMKYVGERNREIVSGLSSSVWSGSAYFSAVAYGVLRHMNVSYVNIFLITAGLYVFAVYFYNRLLKDYKRREALGLIS